MWTAVCNSRYFRTLTECRPNEVHRVCSLENISTSKCVHIWSFLLLDAEYILHKTYHLFSLLSSWHMMGSTLHSRTTTCSSFGMATRNRSRDSRKRTIKIQSVFCSYARLGSRWVDTKCIHVYMRTLSYCTKDWNPCSICDDVFGMPLISWFANPAIMLTRGKTVLMTPARTPAREPSHQIPQLSFLSDTIVR